MSLARNPAWSEAVGLQLVPWVGAGVSSGLRRADNGGPLMPDWTSFLREAVDILSPADWVQILAAIDSGQLEAAATMLRNGVPKARWTSLLRKRFEVSPAGGGADGMRVLRAIWKVSRGLVVTTNYDETLRWTQIEGAAPAQSYGLHAPPDLSTILGATSERPVLWHLHGSIEYPDTIVLDRAEYDRLYGAHDGRHGGGAVQRDGILDATYLCLRTLMATQNLFFVGTSLADPRVNDVLADVHRLFPVARTRHFMVCLENELGSLRKRLSSVGISDYITLLPVRSYEKDLAILLESLSADAEKVDSIDLTERKWIRRRCRAVVAGGAEFIAELRPLIGESAPDEAVTRLRDMFEERELSEFQRAVVQAFRYELDAKIDRMIQSTSAALEGSRLEGVERLNLLLLHAIGLEKRNGDSDIRAAMSALDEIIASSETPDELRVCAEFNRDVCREKLDDPNVTFGGYLKDRKYRLGATELLWPKAWNMELVRTSRRAQPFDYADLFEDVIAAEIYDASTGVGKTIANWGHYVGRGEMDPDLIEQLNKIARNATPTQRLPFLVFLASETNDPRFREAIDEALDRGGVNPTLQRLVQTRQVYGRYTLYGEFLMHGRSWGYVSPTPMYLRGTRDTTSAGGTWNAEADEIARLVERLGLRPLPAVEGDLPIGQGFAGSTVLALLHVGDQFRAAERRRVVNFLDWLSHGFEPSGLDHDSIVAQTSGFYRRGEWRPANPVHLDGLFIRSGSPGTISLRETQSRIERVAGRLVPLADLLTKGIADDSELRMDVFADYCLALSRAAVYTDEQMELVEQASSHGLLAKSIGGLQAKAMVVVGDSGALSHYEAGLAPGMVIGPVRRGESVEIG